MAQEPIGSLRLEILRGKNMPKMDEFGEADPYCIIRFGTGQERTPTCFQTLEPDWENSDGDFEFIFDIQDIDALIHIAVWVRGLRIDDFLVKDDDFRLKNAEFAGRGRGRCGRFHGRG